MALETLDEVGFLTKTIILEDFIPYFESVTTAKGGIPWMLRPKGNYPCEAHFKTVKEWVTLSTTVPLLVILKKYNIRIPWMERAEEFVWPEIERIQEKHVFYHLSIPQLLQFLQYTDNVEKAVKALNDLKQWILADSVLCQDKSDEGWGLYGKPHSLCYAPSPNSILYSIFSKEQLEADITTLIKRQKSGGRWGIWYGISERAKLEWAGMQTLLILKMLKNYDRIEE